MPSLLDRQIFRPAGSVDATPEDLGLDYEEVFLTAADGVRLHAWFFPGKSGVTLVFFHGNAGDVTHRLDMIPPAAGRPRRVDPALRLPGVRSQRGRANRARGLPRLAGRRPVGAGAGGDPRGRLLRAFPRGRRRD